MRKDPNKSHGRHANPEELASPASPTDALTPHELLMRLSLPANKEISRLFFDHAPVAVAMLDCDMAYVAVSKRWKEDFSLGDRDIIGASHYEIFPEISLGWKSVFRRAFAGEIMRAEEDRFARADGTTQWIRWKVLPWHASDGNVGGIAIFSEDITRYKQTELEIHRLNAALELRVQERTAQLTAEILVRKQNEISLSQFEAIIESSDDAIISKTLDGTISSWNGGAERMFGYKRAEALGKSIYFLIPEQYQHEETMLLQQIRSGILVRHYETVRKCKDGKLIDVSVSVSPLRDQNGVIVSASKIARDITERKAAEEQIRNLVFYDPLTQLPNRRMLNDRLNQAIATSKRGCRHRALMFLDLDGFKALNDTHGHDMGDLLLIEVARRICSCVRETDTVARFGGDEFVIMLTGLDGEKAESTAQARVVAEKIRAMLAEPYLLPTHREGEAECSIVHHCTSSIGVELFISHGTSLEDILKRADVAMYKAKAAGGNSILFYDSQDA